MIGRSLVGRPARARRPSTSLCLEALEQRLCLSAKHDFFYLDSFDNSTIERYVESTGAPAPSRGRTGATFVPTEPAGLDHPLSAIIGYDYLYYETNLETNQVFRFDALTGRPKPAPGKPGAIFIDADAGLEAPAGLVFGPDGNIYVSNAETSASNVFKFDPSGGFLGVYATLNHTGGATGLVWGPDGKLYVSTRFSSGVERCDGTSCSDFVTSGSGGLSRTAGMVFGPDGHFYVGSENTNQVLRYNGITGAFEGVFVAAGSGGLLRPAGILFGPEGDLYVASADTDSVLRYDGKTGAFVGTYISAANGGAPGGPRGISFFNTDPITLKYEANKSNPGGQRSPADLQGGSDVLAVLSPQRTPGTSAPPLQTGTHHRAAAVPAEASTLSVKTVQALTPARLATPGHVADLFIAFPDEVGGGLV
jgi:hypothetical protein